MLQNLGKVWGGELSRQLDFELELERYGLKKRGNRRDRRAGGARTYESWLFNLGLIFYETENANLRPTLAGEALLDGEAPVPIITNQLMKLQYPSPYSIRSRVDISYRFQVRPFRFLLSLMRDSRIERLSQNEIARFVITEGENESLSCFENVVKKILDYREQGDKVLPENFNRLYPSSTTGVRGLDKTLDGLGDVANTFINYLEYTQFIERNDSAEVIISPKKEDDVVRILNDGSKIKPFLTNHSFGIENFQRNYGLASGQNRDNRGFGGQVITEHIFRERRVRNEVLYLAGTKPITELTMSLVREVSEATGYGTKQVEEALNDFKPNTVSLFESKYLAMANSGRQSAEEFELATVEIFKKLDFKSIHVGRKSLHPDIYIESDSGFSGIIDTKAYQKYSINNDHRNRMIKNYIPTYKMKSKDLKFYMYIAAGFGSNIDDQLERIHIDTNINGCVITANNLLRLLSRYQMGQIEHSELEQLFKSNGTITFTMINSL